MGASTFSTSSFTREIARAPSSSASSSSTSASSSTNQNDHQELQTSNNENKNSNNKVNKKRSSSYSSSSSPSANRSTGSLTIRIRPATREDIAEIERCNLLTLPENYPISFYDNHVHHFKRLALVAEAISEDLPGAMYHPHYNNNNINDNNNNIEKKNDELSGGVYSKTNVDSAFAHVPPPQQHQQSPFVHKQIVGYVLGRVEEEFVPSASSPAPLSSPSPSPSSSSSASPSSSSSSPSSLNSL